MNNQRRQHVPEPVARSGPAPVPHFVNRAEELRQISTWAGDVNEGSILAIVGIGGIGKTALVSEWFSNYAKSGALFQGSVWWSFYEQAANHFFIECFSHLTGTSVDESVVLPPEALVEGISRRLQEGKFLLVLDGLEMEMSAYSVGQGIGASAATTSYTMRSLGSAMASLLRLCVRRDSASKILLTSRLAPVDLEDSDGHPLEGVQVLRLGPLEETAARHYFSQFAIEQSPGLIRLARQYEFHPLLLSLLAHKLVSGPMALERLPLSVRTLVEESIGELGRGDRIVAEQIAAFDMPVRYSDLVYALVGKGYEFARESELDQSLSRLQNLGLITWNQTENTYAMHPVIKGAIRQNGLSLPAE